MRNCKGCKFAVWDKDHNGRLSRSGKGKCEWEVKLPSLPASIYWEEHPRIIGGYIDRFGELSNHCTYYTREEKKAS